MIKHILKKILEKSRQDPTNIHSNLEERCPNRQCIRLDVLFEDLVYVWCEPIPYLRLFLDRPVLGSLESHVSQNRCGIERMLTT